MVLCTWIRLLALLCIVVECSSGNTWFSRAKSVLFRSKTQDFLRGVNGRLESDLHAARQVVLSLQEENAELKQKVISLKSSSQIMKKELVLLRLEHMREMSEASTRHTETITELRESFKKFRSKEVSSVTKKLEDKFVSEKKDLLAAIEAKHAREIQSLKDSIRSADGVIHQNNKTIQELNMSLNEKDQEIGKYVERERLSVSDKEKLIEEIATLSQSLQHIKLAEEARVMDHEGTVAAAAEPVVPVPVQHPHPEPQPESLPSVPEGVTHPTGAALQERGAPVMVETTSRKMSRKVGGLRSRRAFQSHPHQQP